MRKNIIRDLNATIGTLDNYDVLKKIVGTRAFAHSIRIDTQLVARSYKEAINLVNHQDYRRIVADHNYITRWDAAIKTTIALFATGATFDSGAGTSITNRFLQANRLRVVKKSTNIYHFNIDSAEYYYATHFDDILREFRVAVYNQWRKDTGIEASILGAESQQALIGFQYAMKSTVGEEVMFHVTTGGPGSGTIAGAAFRHGKKGPKTHHTTVGSGTIAKVVEDELRQPRYFGMNVGYVVVDLIDDILKYALGVEWKLEDFVLPDGTTEQRRVIHGEINPLHLPEETDLRNLRDKVPAIEQAINEFFYERSKFVGSRTAAAFESSASFNERAAAHAQYKLLRDLMDKNKKYVAVKKVKTKPIKAKPKSGVIQRSRKPPKKRYATRQIKGTPRRQIPMGKERGEGREASTSTAADLARLRQYINRRLPAEVRRNMGRPGLQNRTGRFSNSVQLLSLTQAQNTAMAKYTYLLRPYQTFENTGRKRWPMAYNPKPIIAKSIRNLALGRIEQKLTVRRV